VGPAGTSKVVAWTVSVMLVARRVWNAVASRRLKGLGFMVFLWGFRVSGADDSGEAPN
jgi:hypothetical protein